MNYAKSVSKENIEEIINNIANNRSRHDQLPRAFEVTSYGWEGIIDFGAYRDLQRQRMCVQFRQNITPDYNFEVPDILFKLRMEDEIKEALSSATDAYYAIADKHPEEAQYVLPLATNVRVMFNMNLRELDEVAPLRTGKHCHESYRKVILEVVKQIKETHPYLGSLLRTGDVE
jgi:hypothetical protein